MANIAAIKNKQYGPAKNDKLKLETLFFSVGANLQAIIQIINCLRKGWKSLKMGWKIEKLENRQRLQKHTFKDILFKQSLDCSEKSPDH